MWLCSEINKSNGVSFVEHNSIIASFYWMFTSISRLKQHTNATINFISEARDFHNYDNDVNRATSVEDHPEIFSKIPGSTLGIDAMVTVSKHFTHYRSKSCNWTDDTEWKKSLNCEIVEADFYEWIAAFEVFLCTEHVYSDSRASFCSCLFDRNHLRTIKFFSLRSQNWLPYGFNGFFLKYW